MELLSGWKLKSNFSIKLSNPDISLQRSLIQLDEAKQRMEHKDFEKKF
jgi:hypothetical protein